MPVEWDGQHPESRVEPQRKVSCAPAAKPEMLAPAQLALIAIEIGIQVGGAGLCHEQLAFPQRAERNGAGGVSALMQHGNASSLLYRWSVGREHNHYCTPEAERRFPKLDSTNPSLQQVAGQNR